MKAERIYKIDTVNDRRGNLSVVESSRQIPFEIKRAFWIYDVPALSKRGGHAHRKCHQFIVAMKGSLEVVLDDGSSKEVVKLDSPDIGLHIPPGIWAHEQSFSEEVVYCVFASDLYDDGDYIRDYDEYLKIMGR